MGIIKQTYLIKAPLEKVWRALVDSAIIAEWSGTEAVMDGKEGTKFKLWDGDIHGKNIKVVKNKFLEQEWYSGNWEKPSVVTFSLVEKGRKTHVFLRQTGFPEAEGADLAQGWKDYYLGEIQKLFEK